MKAVLNQKSALVIAGVLLLAGCGGSSSSDSDKVAPTPVPTIEPTVEPTPGPVPDPAPAPLSKQAGDCFVVGQGDKVEPVGEGSEISLTYKVDGSKAVCVTAGSVNYQAAG